MNSKEHKTIDTNMDDLGKEGSRDFTELKDFTDVDLVPQNLTTRHDNVDQLPITKNLKKIGS